MRSLHYKLDAQKHFEKFNDLVIAGINCEINIDDCKRKPCDYGKCIDKINGYECVCEPGYTGERAQQHLCVRVCVCENR